jgi:chromosomal replication initiation ATPase DnaA
MTNDTILIKELELGRNIFCDDELFEISREYDTDLNELKQTLEDNALQYGYEAMMLLENTFRCEKRMEKVLREKYNKPVQIDIKIMREVNIGISPAVNDVLEKVLKVCGCTYQELRSKNRKRERIKGVHLFWYVCTQERLLSYQSMSELMNRKTHSVAIQMSTKFKELLEVGDPIYTEIYEQYKNL